MYKYIYICIYVYIYMYVNFVCVCVCAYIVTLVYMIYVYVERERNIHICIYIYMQTCVSPHEMHGTRTTRRSYDHCSNLLCIYGQSVCPAPTSPNIMCPSPESGECCVTRTMCRTPDGVAQKHQVRQQCVIREWSGSSCIEKRVV